MISDNIHHIKQQIKQAAEQVNRNASEIKLVAVSKRFPVEAIEEAYHAGHFLFGENYIQELIHKRPAVPMDASFHFIGNLQSNKARHAAELCDMVETVDREKLGKALNKHCITLNKTLDVLVQVNLGNEPQKSGVERGEAETLIQQLNQLDNLRVCGLMTIPPATDTPEESRAFFRELRTLSEDFMTKGLFPKVAQPELSMGMSSDFHVAIEEGATIIRIGTALFGQRGT